MQQAKVINKNRVYVLMLGYMEKQTDGIHVRTESQPENERQAERFSAVDHRETHRGTFYLYFRSRHDRRRCRLPENNGHFPTSAQNARKIAKTPFSSLSSFIVV